MRPLKLLKLLEMQPWIMVASTTAKTILLWVTNTCQGRLCSFPGFLRCNKTTKHLQNTSKRNCATNRIAYICAIPGGWIFRKGIVKHRQTQPCLFNLWALDLGNYCVQVLYGILVQHFANLSGHSPPDLHLLDALTVQILELTPEVPLYAATTALARLKKMQEQLIEATQSPGGAIRRHPSRSLP